MKYIKKFESKTAYTTHQICKDLDILDYEINDDGTIDVYDDVDLDGMDLIKIPVKFNRVNGNFIISNNYIVSLEGCPKYVRGRFDCQNNKLDKNLVGGPTSVGKDYNCYSNMLTSLEGSPNRVTSFRCCRNKLTSLEGGPKEVDFTYSCFNNQLTSLKGVNYVGKLLDCESNKLTSLMYVPEFNDSKFNISCKGNPLPQEILSNHNIINRIVELQDEFMIWNSDGSLNKHNFQELMKELKIKKEI